MSLIHICRGIRWRSPFAAIYGVCKGSGHVGWGGGGGGGMCLYSVVENKSHLIVADSNDAAFQEVETEIEHIDHMCFRFGCAQQPQKNGRTRVEGKGASR